MKNFLAFLLLNPAFFRLYREVNGKCSAPGSMTVFIFFTKGTLAYFPRADVPVKKYMGAS
jgi:hypothetical protein